VCVIRPTGDCSGRVTIARDQTIATDWTIDWKI
jgi:hypothetical protein